MNLYVSVCMARQLNKYQVNKRQVCICMYLYVSVCICMYVDRDCIECIPVGFACLCIFLYAACIDLGNTVYLAQTHTDKLSRWSMPRHTKQIPIQ